MSSNKERMNFMKKLSYIILGFLLIVAVFSCPKTLAKLRSINTTVNPGMPNSTLFSFRPTKSIVRLSSNCSKSVKSDKPVAEGRFVLRLQ